MKYFSAFMNILMNAFVMGSNVPDTVSELIVNDYLGHWFQVYQAPTNVIFQGYGTCIFPNEQSKL